MFDSNNDIVEELEDDDLDFVEFGSLSLSQILLKNYSISACTSGSRC